MANINKDNSMMEFPLQIKRQYAAPVDPTSIFYSLADAENYAKTGATAYVGQMITVVDETAEESTVYVIKNTAGDLVEVEGSIEWGTL